jgi:hypothetical protein
LRNTARLRALAWAITIVALLYSGFHFLQSGIVFPLQSPNLGKFDEQGTALRHFIRTGETTLFGSDVQYGPVFELILHPVLLATHTDQQLANWLYAIQLVCLAVAFVLTAATLKPLADQRDWTLIAAWLVVLWLNFAPVYTTLAVKSVENWELALLALALYAYVRERLWTAGFALAAAALVKVLPLIFFYYLLITNRRAFVRAAVALLALLLVGQSIYGSPMGLRYLPHVAKSAVGNSYGLLWHENLSLKAAAAKLFGRLIPPRSPYTLTLTTSEQRKAAILGDTAVFITMALLTLVLFRSRARTVNGRIWEWSLVSVVMLIASPNTTFEYATLVLGAISYGVVRLATPGPNAAHWARRWIWLGSSMFFLGVLLPRQVLNTVTFVGPLSRRAGITHLTPSEAYQFLCFPLLGLVLLTIALWQLRPAADERVMALPADAIRS